MELTQVKPFGRRRKTYFYGVAGTVLAAHVVVGAIIHVMPPELEEPAIGVGIEMNLVDRLLPESAVESSAVKMIEDAVGQDLELPIFEPVWEASPVEPDLEPIGPTESVLPELTDYPPEPSPEPFVSELTIIDPDPNPVVAPTPSPVSAVISPKPPVKKIEPEIESRPPIKKKASPPRTPPNLKPKPEPKLVANPEPEPARAIPVAKPSGRRGLFDRRSSASKSQPEKLVHASWSERPPPFYPYEQRKLGVEGTAHVRVSISSSGRITSARLVKSTGNSELDQAALLSVKKGVMNPARRGGRAVSSEMIVPFEFYR